MGNTHGLQCAIEFIVQLVSMPNDQNKSELLSSKLDFEKVKFTASKAEPVDFFDLDFDVEAQPDLLDAYLPSPPLSDEESGTSAVSSVALSKVMESPVATSTTSVTSGVSSSVEPLVSRSGDNKSKPKTGQKKDNFAFYAALVALAGFLMVFGVIFYVGAVRDSANTPSYLTLPEQVTNFDGQVVRIKVTVQVERKDRDWLADNKAKLIELFPIILTRIDPNDLHSEKGFESVREKLRTELNREMKTDKIQSVLMDQLLTQTRE